MIIVNTLQKDGLGNRLFMIAAAIAHAARMKTEAWLCDFGYQDYFTGPFNIKVNTDVEQCIFKGEFHSVYKEEGYVFKKLPDKKNLILNGYWQNENYFVDYKNEILHHFFPNDNFLALIKNDDFFRQILLHKNSISLHIRRGDYKGLQSVFPQLSSDYYSRALIHIRNRISLHEPSLVVIFTDGMRDEISFIFEVCRKLGFSTLVLSENRKDIFDMMLMACCRHHIVANSTFSWWGAYLSANFLSLHDFLPAENKIVVSPRYFFTQDFCNGYQGGISNLECTPYLPCWHKV